MLRQVVPTLLFTAVCVSFWAGSVLAGQFTVDPIKLIFTNRAKTASAKIINKDSRKLTVQISAMAWGQDEDGVDEYEATKDFLFFPRLATLAPNSERLVRIAYRGPSAKDSQRTYRLFVEELPVDKVGEGTAMRLTIKFSIPIFVEPVRKTESWKIEGLSIQRGYAAVKVQNTGNTYIVTGQMMATGYDKPGGTELFKAPFAGWYVLPGMAGTFATRLRREQCLKVRTLKMEVEVGENKKELVGQVKPGPAECPSKEEEEKKEAAAEASRRRQQQQPKEPQAAKQQ